MVVIPAPRRHGHYLKAPYALLALADDRCSRAQAGAIVREFDNREACCHRVGVAQHLRKARVDVSTPSGQAWMWPFALSCTLSLSNTERQHAANKSFNRLAGGGSKWEQFAAQNVLKQAREALREAKIKEASAAKADAGGEGLGGSDLCQKPYVAHSMLSSFS